MKRLDGQNAVITGGASGIGLATARLFLDSARKRIRQAKDASGRRDASKFLDDWERKYLPH